MKVILKFIVTGFYVLLISACGDQDSSNTSNVITQISGPAVAQMGVKGPSVTLNIAINSDGTPINANSSNVIDDIRVTNISPAAPGLSASGCISSGNGSSCNITLTSNGSVVPNTYVLTIQGTNTTAVTTNLSVAYPKLSFSNSVMNKTAQNITLANISPVSVPLNINSIAASAAGWRISNDNCSGKGTLAKGQSCTFTINSADTTPNVTSNINIAGNYFATSPYTPIPTITTTPTASTISYTAPSQASGGTINFTQQSITFQIQNTATDPTAISIPVGLTYDSGFAGGLTVSTSGNCTAASGTTNYYVPANGTCAITMQAADINSPASGSQLILKVGSRSYIYNLVVPGVTGFVSINSERVTGEAAYEKITVMNNTGNPISNLGLSYSNSVASNLIENAAPSTSGESATNCPTNASVLANGASCYFWLHALKQSQPNMTSSGLTVSVLYTQGGSSSQSNSLPIVAATYLYAIGSNGIYAWDGNSSDNWTILANIGNGMSGQVLFVDPITGNLYAGGKFDSLTQPNQATVNANNLAYWDGYSWEAAWQGLGGNAGLGKDANAAGVFALAETTAGMLYAAGAIDNNSGTSYVADIDTTAVSPSWSDMSGALDAQVNALTLDGQNNLYAGGNFSLSTAKYTGSAWNSLPSPTTIQQVFSAQTNQNLESINALLLDSSNQLLATASSKGDDGLMGWGDSTTGWVYTKIADRYAAAAQVGPMAFYNGDLYITDNFTYFGAALSSNLRKKVGNTFERIGGFDRTDVPLSLYADNTNLYIGLNNGIYTVNVSNAALSPVSNNISDSINHIIEGPYLCVGDPSICRTN